MRPDLLVWIGIGLVTLGCGWMWRPLAPLFLGVTFIALGIGLGNPKAGA